MSELVTTIEAHDSYVLGLLFTPDSKTLISSGMDSQIKLWAVPDWRLVRTLTDHENSVNCLSLTDNGRYLISGSTDCSVKIWSLSDGSVRHTLRDRKKTVAAVSLSGDGKQLAAGWYGGRATVWNMDGELVCGIKASKKNLVSATLSPDGTQLATAGLGDDITIWSVPEGKLITTLSGHETAVYNLRFVGNGRYLISLGYEQTIIVWDTTTWQAIRTLPLPTGTRGFTFSPDEQTIVLSLESRIQLWHFDNWAQQEELSVSTKVINGIAFSPDGNWLAAGAADKKIRVWQRI